MIRLDALLPSLYAAVLRTKAADRIRIIHPETKEVIAAVVSAEDYAFLEEIDAELDKRDIAELSAIRAESAQEGTVTLGTFLQTLDK